MKRAALLVLVVALAAACGKRAGTGTESAAAAASPTPAQTVPGEMTEEERRGMRTAATPTPAGTATATATPVQRRASDVPVETVLWTRDTPLAAQDYEILPKEGVLRKVAAPATDADQTRYFPYALDYWGIVGSAELSAALDAHIGREVKIEGHFRKVYDDGKWTYEVEPKRIVLLPAK